MRKEYDIGYDDSNCKNDYNEIHIWEQKYRQGNGFKHGNIDNK